MSTAPSRIITNLHHAFAGLPSCGREPSGCACDPEDAPPSACMLLCDELEACTILAKAAASFDADDDFRVVDTELLAEPYLAPHSTLPHLVRQCPRLKVSLSLEFDALDDEPADIHRQLAMRLHFLAERIERRAECAVKPTA